jgi:hypothetical protein
MSREEVCGEEVARLNALREVERELRNAYGDVDDVWPHFAALRAAPSDVEAVVALGRIKAIAAHYRDESKVSLRSSMQAIYETADKAYDPDDLRGYRVAAPSITDDPEYFPSTEYERGYADGRVAAPSDGLLPCEDPEEPCDADGRDEHRWCDNCIARAVIARHGLVLAAPSDGLRSAVESITRTTQRPAGRGPYVEHEVDEGHAPGEPCRFCDELAATDQPETDG